MAFNIFGPADKSAIKVGYIDPERGYVTGVSILEANKYAALNPGTQFIVTNRQITKFLNINEVNALIPQDLLPTVEPSGCDVRGLRPDEIDPNDIPPKLVISGSGGVGAVGNPIFGRDGSLLAVQVVKGGFGYTTPPSVRIRDTSGSGAGAVIRALTGNIAPTLETFPEEDDFEIYDFTGDNEVSGYGDRFGPNGENLGRWDPNLFATLAADPIKFEIKKYQDFLRQVDDAVGQEFINILKARGALQPPGTESGSGSGNLNFFGDFFGATITADPQENLIEGSQSQLGKGITPTLTGILGWWNTRKQVPIAVTFRERTRRVKYDVTYWAWGGRPKFQPFNGSTNPDDYIIDENTFMNRYAVSPVPASSAPGSAFPGQWATLEWEEFFPYTGEYTIRGMADNISKFYLDNELLLETKKFKGIPTDIIKKTVTEGVHRIKIDLYNIPFTQPVLQQSRVPINFDVYGRAFDSGVQIKFIFTSLDGNDTFTLPNVTTAVGSYSRSVDIIPNTDYRIQAVIAGNQSNTVREFDLDYDGLNFSNFPINVSADGKVISLYDSEGDDVNSEFRILSTSPGVDATFSPFGLKLIVRGDVAGDVTIRLKWKDDPSAADVAVQRITIQNTTWIQESITGEQIKTIQLGKPIFTNVGQLDGAIVQGLSSVFGSSPRDIGEGEGNIIFADYTESSSGNDDMLIRVSSNNGSFAASNSRVVRNATTRDLTYRFETSTPPEITASVNSQNFGSVFNTLDFINQADRQLWRTNVYGRGGFLNEYGICPFNTRISLPDNPYAGLHKIRWQGINFPVDGNYNIEIDVDDSVTLFIVDSSSNEVVIEKRGFLEDSSIAVGKQSYTRFFKKGTYGITADLVQKPGGRFSFETDGRVSTTEPSITARFVAEGDQIFLKVDGSGSAEINFNLQTDDDPGAAGDSLSKIRISNKFGNEVLLSRSRESNGRLRERESLTGSTTFLANGKYLVEVIGASAGAGRPRVSSGSVQFLDTAGSDINAELFLRKIGNTEPEPIKGVNPMALAINITPQAAELPRITPESWYENPMGAAFTIDAPLPPIPQEPIPVSEGRCPNNPIWSTRFPGAAEKWYPVNLESRWSKFVNRFAISPLPPLALPNSDGGGGIVYRNTWDFQAPYSGFYGLKGAGDNVGRVLIDNGETYIYKLRTFDEVSPLIEKFFLPEGDHQITVEIENEITLTTKTIKKKVFSTQDWNIPSNVNPRVPVTFDVYGQGSIQNTSINFAFTSEDGTDSFVFKSQPNLNGQGPYNYKRTIDVLPDVNYRVEAVSTAEPVTLPRVRELPLDYDGLNFRNLLTRVSPERNAIFLVDGEGDDVNCEFRILSSSPLIGAKFDTAGRKIVTTGGTGDITLRLSWKDDPAAAGVAVRSITVGGVTFRQTGITGEQIETIPLNKNLSIGPFVVEQGTLDSGSFAKLSGAQRSISPSNAVFADIIGSPDDVNDMQIRSSSGIFTQSNPTSKTGTANAGVGPFEVITETRTTFDLTFRVERADVVSTTTFTKNNVTYSGPEIYRYREPNWSGFMNNINVSPRILPIDVINPGILGTREFTWTNVDFFDNGTYEILLQADNVAVVFIQGVRVAQSSSFRGTPPITRVNLSRGRYEIKVQLTNIPTEVDDFISNPTGFALSILKSVSVPDGNSKSWVDNPIGVSAILIPPPCPKLVEGVGVVTSILVDSPGNFPLFTPSDGAGFPVTLKLTAIDVESPGINFSPNDVVLVSTPNRPDIELPIKTGTFGQVLEVSIPEGPSPFTGGPSPGLPTPGGSSLPAEIPSPPDLTIPPGPGSPRPIPEGITTPPGTGTPPNSPVSPSDAVGSGTPLPPGGDIGRFPGTPPGGTELIGPNIPSGPIRPGDAGGLPTPSGIPGLSGPNVPRPGPRGPNVLEPAPTGPDVSPTGPGGGPFGPGGGPFGPGDPGAGTGVGPGGGPFGPGDRGPGAGTGVGPGDRGPGGSSIAPDGSALGPGGNRIAPDGTVFRPDGTGVTPGGTIIDPNGTITTPDGTRISPNGTITTPDGTRISPDGNVIGPDGNPVTLNDLGNSGSGPDGTRITPDGTRVGPDGTRVGPDGTVTSPDGTVITPGPGGGTIIGGPGPGLPEITGGPGAGDITPSGFIATPSGVLIGPDGTLISPDGTKVRPGSPGGTSIPSSGSGPGAGTGGPGDTGGPGFDGIRPDGGGIVFPGGDGGSPVLVATFDGSGDAGVFGGFTEGAGVAIVRGGDVLFPGGPGAGGPDGPPAPSLTGITEFPSISIRSNTGIGFRGIPRFEPIIVPEGVLPDQEIIQVTDLVGLKQTGFVNGKPYYGSVFSKDGLLYAGIYETIGKLVRVYDTLQGSIDGEVTTRPSAILRQGTDITNNDPRLNIPGTPNNLI